MSILNTIKTSLGIQSSVTAFDTDIITAINTALMSLTQIGVGPSSGFKISTSSQTWEQFLGTAVNLEAAKSYVHLKTRMLFDPPASQALLTSMEKMADEFLFRLIVQLEPVVEEGEITDE